MFGTRTIDATITIHAVARNCSFFWLRAMIAMIVTIAAIPYAARLTGLVILGGDFRPRK